jgi:hypothetical protein
MLKKAIHAKAFATDGWLSFDPVDAGLIEAVTKPFARAKKGSCSRSWRMPLNTSEVRPCTEPRWKTAISRSAGVVFRAIFILGLYIGERRGRR